MRVAIVENTGVTHHGQVGVALHQAAALVEVFRPFAGEPLPSDPDRYDALIVFGGEQSALSDDTHPYLPRLAALMRSFSAADRAVLGICLGAQVLARGFGATNHIGTAPEFGWRTVALTAEGRADPLLGAQAAAFPIFQWHSDTFTIPAGATHLATTPTAAAQAFRIGRATWGTQFHFEASRAVVGDWVRRFPDLMERQEPGFTAALPARSTAEGARADVVGLAIARAFVAQIGR